MSVVTYVNSLTPRQGDFTEQLLDQERPNSNWANENVRPTWINLLKDVFKQLNAFERFVLAMTLVVLVGFYFLKPDVGMAGIICVLSVVSIWTVLFARIRNIF